MLDIRMIRENPEKVNELLKRRNPNLSIDGILEIDAQRRKVQTQADELRSKRKNISQDELAGELNVKQYVISSWEIGRSEPNIEQIKFLSTYFLKIVTQFSQIFKFVSSALCTAERIKTLDLRSALA